MAWYKEWFDSPLYELMYLKRDDREAAVLADLILEKFNPEDYPTVLDLACGRGRHSINLAKRGFRVTGTDLSENAILKANKKAESEGLDIHFVQRDMRNPLPWQFDLVVNLFTSFGYFKDDEENRQVIGQIAKQVREKGAIVMDYLNADFVRANLVEKEQGKNETLHYNIERKIDDGMVHKKMMFYDKDGQTHEFKEQVKLYTLQWFEDSFLQMGLKIDHLFGDYHGGDYVAEESPRMLFFLTKDSS